jgi:hypothetical protein
VWVDKQSTYYSRKFLYDSWILEQNELQLLEAVDVTGALGEFLRTTMGQSKMASSTADVLKEMYCVFIKMAMFTMDIS